MHAGEIEIGALREEEIGIFAQLMSEGFGLQYTAVRGILLADPYYDLKNKRVLRVAGRVVSCLTIIDTQCWIGQSLVSLAGVAGVATWERERRQGYAGKLLENTLALLYRRGYALSALIPFSSEYYRKFGWEIGSTICRYQLLPRHLNPYSEWRNLRSATLDDIPALQSLYNAQAMGRAFQCLRDHRRWQYLLAMVKQSLVYETPNEGVTGYLFYEFRQQEEGYPVLRVVEMEAIAQEAERGPCGFLAMQERVASIEWDAGAGELPRLLCHLKHVGDPLPGVALLPGIMSRIVHLPNLLEALVVEWHGFRGMLALGISDPFSEEGFAAVRITGDGERCRYESISEEEVLLAPHSLIGEVRAWSQVLTGYVEWQNACSLGLLKASSAVAMEYAGMLFPTRLPFLPPADHF